MKKAFFAALTALVALASSAFTAKAGDVRPDVKIHLDQPITRLVVEDRITVVLTNESNSDIRIEGAKPAVRKLRASATKGKLYLWMAGGVSGRNRVPSNHATPRDAGPCCAGAQPATPGRAARHPPPTKSRHQLARPASSLAKKPA